MSDSFSSVSGRKSDVSNADQPKRDIGAQAGVVRDEVRELGHQTGAAAKEMADNVKKTVSDKVAQGKDKLDAVGGSVSNYVKENPLKAVLFAAGAGAVIGAIWARKR